MDFGKLYCRQHPLQLITNYCTNGTCCVGLCASCICTHTDNHSAVGTVPKYHNIRAVFTETHEAVRGVLIKLEDSRNKIAQLRTDIAFKKDTIGKAIRKAREDCLKAVEDYFNNAELQVTRDLESEQVKHGYHGKDKIDWLETSINKEINSLIEVSADLNTFNFLQTTRRLRQETFAQVEAYNERIIDEVTNNFTYTPSMTYDNSKLDDLVNALKKMLIFGFVVPKPRNSLQAPTDSAYYYRTGQSGMSTSQSNQMRLSIGPQSMNMSPQSISMSSQSIMMHNNIRQSHLMSPRVSTNNGVDSGSFTPRSKSGMFRNSSGILVTGGGSSIPVNSSGVGSNNGNSSTNIVGSSSNSNSMASLPPLPPTAATSNIYHQQHKQLSSNKGMLSSAQQQQSNYKRIYSNDSSTALQDQYSLKDRILISNYNPTKENNSD